LGSTIFTNFRIAIPSPPGFHTVIFRPLIGAAKLGEQSDSRRYSQNEKGADRDLHKRIHK